MRVGRSAQPRPGHRRRRRRHRPRRGRRSSAGWSRDALDADATKPGSPRALSRRLRARGQLARRRPAAHRAAALAAGRRAARSARRRRVAARRGRVSAVRRRPASPSTSTAAARPVGVGRPRARQGAGRVQPAARRTERERKRASDGARRPRRTAQHRAREGDLVRDPASMRSRPRCSRPTSTRRTRCRMRASRSTARPARWSSGRRRSAPDGDIDEEYDDTPDDFGRVAAMTARQVILQRLRDAEHDQTFGEYSGREGDIVTGVDPGRRPGRAARARPGRHRQGRGDPAAGGAGAGRGVHARHPDQGLRRGRRPAACAARRSRSAAPIPTWSSKLFALEVPEIADGSVEIVAVAREAGHRTKIAVRTSVDRGSTPRAPASGRWASGCATSSPNCTARRSTSSTGPTDPATYVGNALSPAHVVASRGGRSGRAAGARRRPGLPAVAGDRPGGPERAARRPADRLAHRHPQRRRGRRPPRHRAQSGRRARPRGRLDGGRRSVDGSRYETGRATGARTAPGSHLHRLPPAGCGRRVAPRRRGAGCDRQAATAQCSRGPDAECTRQRVRRLPRPASRRTRRTGCVVASRPAMRRTRRAAPGLRPGTAACPAPLDPTPVSEYVAHRPALGTTRIAAETRRR